MMRAGIVEAAGIEGDLRRYNEVRPVAAVAGAEGHVDTDESRQGCRIRPIGAPCAAIIERELRGRDVAQEWGGPSALAAGGELWGRAHDELQLAAAALGEDGDAGAAGGGLGLRRWGAEGHPYRA